MTDLDLTSSILYRSTTFALFLCHSFPLIHRCVSSLTLYLAAIGSLDSTRELAEEGYSGCEVRVTHARTEIIIRATHTQDVLGDKGRRIRELKALVEKRFKFPEGSLELYAEKVQFRGLSAVAQAESLRYKLLGGLAMRRSVPQSFSSLPSADELDMGRACYGVLRFVMESGAKGCEVVVSGKLRAARAKSMKFTDGFMIHSGQPARDFVDYAVRHVLLRQGVLGIKVKM